MNIKIRTDGLWPVFQIDKEYGQNVEVTENEFEELNSLQLQANQLHDKLQRKLGKLLGS